LPCCFIGIFKGKILLDVFSVTSPIFIIIFIGYFAVRFDVVPKSSIKVLGIFVVNFALPAMLFKVISERPINDIINPTYLFAYTAGSLIAFLFSLFIANKLRGKNFSTSTILGMGGSVSNSGFIGYPIVIQLLGPQAQIPVVLTMLVELVIMVPFVMTLAESSTNKNDRFIKSLTKSLLKVIKSPLIVGIFLGLLCSTFSIEMPENIMKVIDMFAVTAGSIALFFIGGSLVGLKVNGMFTDISLIMAGKLFIHPLAIFFVFLIFPPIDPLFQIAAVIMACCPMSSLFPVLGQKYNIDGFCSAILVPTTIVSFISLSTFIWFLEKTSPFS
jgi:malonate transporter